MSDSFKQYRIRTKHVSSTPSGFRLIHCPGPDGKLRYSQLEAEQVARVLVRDGHPGAHAYVCVVDGCGAWHTTRYAQPGRPHDPFVRADLRPTGQRALWTVLDDGLVDQLRALRAELAQADEHGS